MDVVEVLCGFAEVDVAEGPFGCGQGGGEEVGGGREGGAQGGEKRDVVGALLRGGGVFPVEVEAVEAVGCEEG